MNILLSKSKVLIMAGLTMGMMSCETEVVEPNDSLVVPDTYTFMRDNSSSVSYPGQTDRLNQLAEMKALLSTANSGTIIDGIDLLDMFSNKNDNGNGNFSFTSSKQLKNKTFDLDHTYFENILIDAASRSVDADMGAIASDGVGGLIERGSKGEDILVNANGFEYTQIFEKGIMGATFFNQIVNSYLTEEKIGAAVDNTNLVEDKNYTKMEHHWDEAFGYFGAPEDFTSNYAGTGTAVYWAKYSNTSDDLIGFNDILMGAYKKGRAAISDKRATVKNNQVEIINEELERVAAATAIHYANEAKGLTDQGDLLHVLSECYAFTRALRYANPGYRKMTPAEIDTLLTITFADNLWTVTVADLDQLIDTLSATYNFTDVKDIL